MARVTVEDCIDKVQNRFELVMVAAQRARKISSGAALTIERDNDKNPVVSLREIAAETVDVSDLKEDLIRNYQRMVVHDEDDSIDLMDGEEEWSTIAAQQQANQDSEAGMYDDENIDDEDDEEPSLESLAGNPRDDD